MNWEGVVKANLGPDVDRIESLDMGLVYLDGTTCYVRDDTVTNLSDRDYIKKSIYRKNHDFGRDNKQGYKKAGCDARSPYF